MKRITVFFVFLTITLSAFSQQNKCFFDKLGNSTNESNAYYYRESQDAQKNKYKSYYVSNSSIYFEGIIKNAVCTNENNNIYLESCKWYYKNGKLKEEKNFDASGLLNGVASYYFETGKLAKEIDYKAGKIVNNSYREYDDDGKVTTIFEETFKDNSNEWDLYDSDKSSSKIAQNKLSLSAYTNSGTSRYIYTKLNSQNFILEADINTAKSNGEKAGVIWGFKDWQNFNYFFIKNSYYFCGSVFEGISVNSVDGMFSADIKSNDLNNLKILSNNETTFFTINGSINFKCPNLRNVGNKVGYSILGKGTVSCEKLIVKNNDSKMGENISNDDMSVKATGSGLIINEKGYILTNYHVVENSNSIRIELHKNGVEKQYSAKVIQKDLDNDLALLKIDDADFKIDPIPYSFKESGNVEVGSSVFTIGFPFALGGMGKEAKFADGKISSKTGYNNAVNIFQATIPVQPGNSGGPVFNDKAQLIGIVNAKFVGGDNVSYAIKLNYIKNLIELLPETLVLPSSSALSNVSLEEKIKAISNYVVLIKLK